MTLKETLWIYQFLAALSVMSLSQWNDKQDFRETVFLKLPVDVCLTAFYQEVRIFNGYNFFWRPKICIQIIFKSYAFAAAKLCTTENP
jgi:hypothetical protein